MCCSKTTAPEGLGSLRNSRTSFLSGERKRGKLSFRQAPPTYHAVKLIFKKYRYSIGDKLERQAGNNGEDR